MDTKRLISFFAGGFQIGRSFIQGRQAYRCTWEGCKEQLSNNSKFEEHLWYYTHQKYLSATCNNSRRFQSSDDHLIYRHNDSVMNYTGADDMTKREKEGRFWILRILLHSLNNEELTVKNNCINKSVVTLKQMLIKHGGGTQKIRQIQLPFTAKPGTLPLSSLKALTREYLKEYSFTSNFNFPTRRYQIFLPITHY
ncbi:hypothetical protein RhiirB3_391689 [Rhizophagus irregularis]|nr:hypothetical protein RhiirB3_391689 [Rhizophagus irregularis]